jgi:hypothetical protein
MAVTFSNVEVFKVPFTWLQTARPMYTVVPMLIVCDPTVVQLTPSADLEPVSVFPLRTRRTQYGAVPREPEVKELLPPVVERQISSGALGMRSMIACLEPAVRVSRNHHSRFGAGVGVLECCDAGKRLIAASADYTTGNFEGYWVVWSIADLLEREAAACLKTFAAHASPGHR